MEAIYLFIVFQIKHFFCDFQFQSQWMLGKLKPWPDFIEPLWVHSLINAIGVGLIVIIFAPILAFVLFIFELISHFVIDMVKSQKWGLNRFPIQRHSFWVTLGFDQMLHQLMYCLYIYLIVFKPGGLF